MVQSSSSTSVGGSKSPSKGLAKPSSSGGQTRQRKGTSGATARRPTTAGGGGMWKFYTEDSPGLKVGPVPVLVLSLLFIASVFLLHIWGKYNRN
ncbi:protein transport protein Sec61 subunit beta-like [Xenia sp. Carnegie-2017]|uniref:protein transport protein Sec61 subunit beta-like n=1 Tax=Xenia sp. Carnegie-2017 TaxID=2897299 RepID=UPI001F03BCAE|nr:protein transport protein Sec61 subunit beta-like [Xenia sp. Carnegie-2017]